jgi:hypothetical protein
LARDREIVDVGIPICADALRQRRVLRQARHVGGYYNPTTMLPLRPTRA